MDYCVESAKRYFGGEMWKLNDKGNLVMVAPSKVIDGWKGTIQSVKGIIVKTGIDCSKEVTNVNGLSNSEVCRMLAKCAKEFGLGDLKFVNAHARYFKGRVLTYKKHGEVRVKGQGAIVNAALDTIGVVYRGEKVCVTVNKAKEQQKAKAKKAK